MVPALSPKRPESKAKWFAFSRADPGLVRSRPRNTAPLRRGSILPTPSEGPREARLHQTLADALRDLSPLPLGLVSRPAQCGARRSALTRRRAWRWLQVGR